MEIKEIIGAVEAILFACGDPVEIQKLAQILEIDQGSVKKILSALEEKYRREDSGLTLLILEESVQLSTKTEYAETVRSILDMRRNMPLSQAALEVLSVIAYNQPVTKAFVEQVRGVDCTGVIGSLMNKNLIEERGRLELPGRPLLYGTTPDFLRCMNISGLSELLPVPSRLEQKEKEMESMGES